ncbi:MFS transporter [Pseudomonas fluorescens]|uniref:MFS transporter n=1 Tax=Pseudomonas fluorescens TaxID=294 RepID=UPI0019145B7E|nr:MFS transporter [Pseudomonas fluorescens]
MQPDEPTRHQTAADNLPPLRYALFRAVWCATLTANICLWMQNVAAAWLMVQFDPSPLMVALVQTAITLPAFLFGLPAGVYADLIDKRRILIVTHAWMLAATVLLFLLLLNDQLTPWGLLLLAFSLGTGSAVSIPAWQATTSDAVPRSVLGAAINLNAIAYNAARAVGPALAGIIIASSSLQWVFALNIVLLVCVLAIFIFGYRPAATTPAPREPLLTAMRTGLRYVRHAYPLHGHIVRTLLFISCASSLWALLPLVAGGDEVGGYGLLVGSLGAGAVVGGILLNQLRPRISNFQRLTTISSIIFLLAMLVAAWTPFLYLTSVTLVLAGAAWINFNSTTSAAFQTTLPAWVRARALAIFMLTFQGSMAIGGMLWGAVANYMGVSWTLTLAAGLIVVGLFLTRHYQMRMGQEAEVTLSAHWAEPLVHGCPSASDGPVAVQVDYQIVAEHQDLFCDQLFRLGHIRKRDGASHWLLYRDLADPQRFSERFIVASWGEHLLQRRRSTLADLEQERQLTHYLQPGTMPSVSHYLLVAPATQP